MKTVNYKGMGIIVVSHGSPNQLNNLLNSLKDQITKNDEIIVIDNHPQRKSLSVAKRHKFVNRIITTKNEGFAKACNLGADEISSSIDVILFLNPDTVVSPGSLRKLKNGIPNTWSAWMGLLIKNDGFVNSAGNIVHMSGLSWCGGFDEKKELFNEKEEVSCLSGACLAIKKDVFNQIGGMPEEYFLYYEDTALSTLLLLSGEKMGLIPTSHIYHDYDFSKSKSKWFYIERNRYIYILENWPISIILLLLPYLFLCELGFFAISIMERRFTLKLRSFMSFILMIRRALSRRKQINKLVGITSAEFLGILSFNIDTKQLGDSRKFKIFNYFSRIYYRVVLKIII